MIPYKPPAFNVEAFNCPHCNAYAKQLWADITFIARFGGAHAFPELRRATCSHCGNYTLWQNEKLIYPEGSAPPPNDDLADEIKLDYREAGSIVNRSPRGATALLRLCIQKLCQQLGEKGKNINDDISSLVKKGLPARIQQSLDIVRVIGNDAVHPGQIDIRDDRDTALRLFELINLIGDAMITQPKEIDKLYASLPQSDRQAIERRDTAKTP